MEAATVGLNPGTRGQLTGRGVIGPPIAEGPIKSSLPTLAEAGIDYKLSSRA